MKSLFLTILLLGLLSALQITGTWYTKAFVVDKSLVPDWKGPRKVFPVTVTALEDGSWEAKTTLLIKGRCLEKKVTLQKTEEPGRYSAYHGKKLVYIEELPESHHCIFYCESQDPGKKFRMGKLMAPTAPVVGAPKTEARPVTPGPWNFIQSWETPVLPRRMWSPWPSLISLHSLLQPPQGHLSSCASPSTCPTPQAPLCSRQTEPVPVPLDLRTLRATQHPQYLRTAVTSKSGNVTQTKVRASGPLSG
uniref:Lipocalin/cytosolic fatty-acid binding domain-containing protein n=1 Tax=Spermophilus dauricus TaxID=99837 RepID=A0A8C9QJ42_SPEDA